MGSMLVTVLFWLTAILIVTALVTEFRTASPAANPDGSKAASPPNEVARPE